MAGHCRLSAVNDTLSDDRRESGPRRTLEPEVQFELNLLPLDMTSILRPPHADCANVRNIALPLLGAVGVTTCYPKRDASDS